MQLKAKLFAAAVATLTVAASSVMAEFPENPIKLIVAAGAGATPISTRA